MIVPVCNGMATLEPLLQGLAAMGARECTLFVDDGSTDGTGAYLEDRGWRVRFRPRRGGPAAARNEGVAATAAPAILFLDADTKPPPDTLERIGRALAAPGVVACVGVYAPRPLNGGFWAHYKACQAEFYHRSSVVTEITWTWASMMATRREIFDAVGGFDETFEGADLEDVELGRRLATRGRIRLDRGWVVAHHFPERAKENVRNHLRRGRMWVELFLRSRRFDNYLTSPGNGASRLAAVVASAGGLAWPWAGSVAGLLFWLGLGIYAKFAGQFVSLAWRRGGFDFVVRVLLADLLLSWVLVVAGFWAIGRSLRVDRAPAPQ